MVTFFKKKNEKEMLKKRKLSTCFQGNDYFFLFKCKAMLDKRIRNKNIHLLISIINLY